MNKLALDNNEITNLINHKTPMFTISIVANMLAVHQRTLRIYDEEGILVPTRTEKNRRLYSIDDVERGKFIQYLTRQLGINLIGVKIIFNLLNQLAVEPENYIEHLQNIAQNLNISQEEQEVTKEKLSKRGRKAKNAK